MISSISIVDTEYNILEDISSKFDRDEMLMVTDLILISL